MATLSTLFYARRQALQRHLENAASPRDVVERIHRELDEIQAEFVESLSVGQTRLAIAFLEAIRLSTTALATPLVEHRAAAMSAGTKAERWSGWLVCGLQAAVVLGMGISLGTLLPGTWLPLLLLVLLAGLTLLRYGLAPSSATSPLASQPAVSFDVHVLLDHIANALGVADHAVLQPAPVEETRTEDADLERFGDVVDFLHQLSGPALRQNAARLLEVAEPLQQLLAKHGLRIETFRAEDAHLADKWLLQPARNPAAREYVVLTPALVRDDGRVVRPGRVCLPASVTAAGGA